MQREGYWDYMGRCLREDREDREKTRSSYVQHNTDIKNIKKNKVLFGQKGYEYNKNSKTIGYFIRRIEELEHKVGLLGGDPGQLELDI